ncbi:MAG: protein kinase, partial [Kofleriaceae bacterium]
MSEDFADFEGFEGDPTSINQIPQNGQSAPRTGLHPQPGSQPLPQFASASPTLSHLNGPPPSQYGTGPGSSPSVPLPPPMMQQPTQMTGMTMTGMPGPPMSQVSGVIAQPTPYVSRSRIYAFVVDETGLPIELGSGRFAKCYLGEERWVESKTTLRRPVAIKALQRNVSPEDQMRFQMEKEILERVQGHPNIVELLGSGEGDSAGFIPPIIRDRVENDFMILELLDMSLEERLKGARQKRRRDDLLAVPLRERI